MIGSFGTEVIFEVSADYVRTFDSFKRDSSARLAKHKRINLPDKTEFLGRELDKVSFNMVFAAGFGLSPKKEITKLRALSDDGAVRSLTIAGDVLGKFIITGLSEQWKEIDNQGNLITAVIAVSLEEYMDV
jgi:phage protein U